MAGKLDIKRGRMSETEQLDLIAEQLEELKQIIKKAYELGYAHGYEDGCAGVE